MRRDANIELYRIILMFGICLLHSVSHSGNEVPWLSNALLWCVDGFVFISGWYGIRFAPSKVLRFLGVTLFASVLALAIGVVLGAWNISDDGFIRKAYSMIIGHWFVSAYLILLLVAPVLNAALELVMDKGVAKIAFPFGLLLFGSWSRSLPILSGLLPSSSGLGEYTGLSLIGVYMTARIVRHLYDSSRLNRRWLKYGFWNSLPMCALGFGGYSSFCAVIVASATFISVKELRVPDRILKVASIAAPSMFAILMLSQGAGWTMPYYELLRANIEGCGLLMKLAWYVFFATTMFLTCLLLDIPRRLLVANCRYYIDNLFRYIDQKCEFIGGG